MYAYVFYRKREKQCSSIYVELIMPHGMVARVSQLVLHFKSGTWFWLLLLSLQRTNCRTELRLHHSLNLSAMMHLLIIYQSKFRAVPFLTDSIYNTCSINYCELWRANWQELFSRKNGQRTFTLLPFPMAGLSADDGGHMRLVRSWTSWTILWLGDLNYAWLAVESWRWEAGGGVAVRILRGN